MERNDGSGTRWIVLWGGKESDGEYVEYVEREEKAEEYRKETKKTAA